MMLLDLATGLGRAVNDLETNVTIFFGCVIFLQVVFLLIGLFRRTTGYRIFLRYYGIIPLAFSILCFQHEMGHYVQGTFMLILTVLSVLLSFRK